METNKFKNIGTWNAKIENDGKAAVLKVDGTFPTNGEKPLFRLSKKDPQGINPVILLLDLSFGTVIDPKGKSSASVNYYETLASRDQYTQVTISAYANEKDIKIAEISI